jgi:site-specific recombinase XerD
MAGLRNLKGKYYSRIWYKNDQGKRREKLIPLNTKSKRRARNLNKEIIEPQETAFKKGVINLDEIKVKKPTKLDHIIDEFYKYLKINDRSQETIDLYRLALDTFTDIYRDTDIELLDQEDYTEFLSIMRDRYPNKNTCNIRLTHIKAFLNWCLETGKIKRLPFKIKKLSVSRTKPRYFTDPEMDQIFEAIEDKELKARVYIHWKTGMRLSEISNSYLDGNYIKLHTAIKNGYERSIPVDQETKKYYQIAKKQTYRNDTYSKQFLRIIRKLGLYTTKEGDKRTFHCLRHTFAVRTYYKTRDIYYVKKLLGHSSVKTTEIYAEFNLDELSQDFDIKPKSQRYKTPNNKIKGRRNRNSKPNFDYSSYNQGLAIG